MPIFPASRSGVPGDAPKSRKPGAATAEGQGVCRLLSLWMLVEGTTKPRSRESRWRATPLLERRGAGASVRAGNPEPATTSSTPAPTRTAAPTPGRSRSGGNYPGKLEGSNCSGLSKGSLAYAPRVRTRRHERTHRLRVALARRRHAGAFCPQERLFDAVRPRRPARREATGKRVGAGQSTARARVSHAAHVGMWAKTIGSSS